MSAYTVWETRAFLQLELGFVSEALFVIVSELKKVTFELNQMSLLF